MGGILNLNCSDAYAANLLVFFFNKPNDSIVPNDLCKEDLEEQKILRKHLKESRTLNHQARIKGTKIEIDGKWYTSKELQEGELNSEKEGKEESSDGSVEESVENDEIEEQKKSRLEKEKCIPRRTKQKRKIRRESKPQAQEKEETY
ncbi:hypothetical protein JTB14_013396 [Gonioctena quinquepunctata]|nr:hypothetical protein JTB14_013396 [Gonioctena quinquepunctata]